jgi:hypothetical protein
MVSVLGCVVCVTLIFVYVCTFVVCFALAPYLPARSIRHWFHTRQRKAIAHIRLTDSHLPLLSHAADSDSTSDSSSSSSSYVPPPLITSNSPKAAPKELVTFVSPPDNAASAFSTTSSFGAASAFTTAASSASEVDRKTLKPSTKQQQIERAAPHPSSSAQRSVPMARVLLPASVQEYALVLCRVLCCALMYVPLI